MAGLPFATWPQVILELKRVTRPGGWIELVEMGNTFHHAGPSTHRFLDWWVAISKTRGIDASKMSQIDVLLNQSQISTIKAETKILAVGKWGGRLGNLLAQDMLAGWPSLRPLAYSLLGIPHHVFDEVIRNLEGEWNMHHTTYEVYFACGQVPSKEIVKRDEAN